MHIQIKNNTNEDLLIKAYDTGKSIKEGGFVLIEIDYYPSGTAGVVLKVPRLTTQEGEILKP